MQILIIGAGVIGSIIAARLAISGNQVTVLEIGQRLEQLASQTISIQDGITGQTITAPIRVAPHFNVNDTFDYILAPVQAHHLGDLLPALAANTGSPNIVIMANSLQPVAAYDQLGPKMLLGFPGMGGGFAGQQVVYRLANPRLQKTSFGELNGVLTPRVKTLVQLFNQAGIPAAAEANMLAWQQTHVSWIVPLAAALYGADIDNFKLASQPELVRKTILAIRETLNVLEVRQIPITPNKFKWLKYLPIGLQVPLWQKALSDPAIEYLAVRHCQAAPQEIQLLAAELTALVDQAGVNAPCYRELLQYLPV